MSDALHTLLEAGRLAPLSYYFARFVARGAGLDMDSTLAQSAALASARHLAGDVCVDLARHAQRPLFEGTAGEGPRGPELAVWLDALRACRPWVGTPEGVAPASLAAPLILDGRRLYLGKYWHFERRVAEALGQRLAPVEDLDLARLGDGLGRLFPADPAKPGAPDGQRLAAALALRRRFAVVSGGPGTGKTTTVVKLLTLLLEQDPDLRVALAAPTGKAAARLGDAVRQGKARVRAESRAAPHVLDRVPEEASTLHRLLGLGFDPRPRYHRDAPLGLDCLVVDEASMIDLPLMARLLDALPERARLVLLGDRDQLASVEAGSVLGDITGRGRTVCYSAGQRAFLAQVGTAPPPDDAGPGPVSGIADAIGLLRESHRFRADSDIGALAGAVNAGRGEAALEIIADPRRGDLAWLEAPPEGAHGACLDWAVERYADYLKRANVAEALAAFEKARVLAALHGGPFGVEDLNRRVEARLQARGLIRGGDDYHGKPVMVTANDYEVGLFNGDVGLLWRDADGGLRAHFRLAEDQVRAVSVRQLPDHVSAYALTVHKSQGSEFDEILLVLPAEPNPVVTRELIYTGITRARRRVTLHGNQAAFLAGCQARVRRGSALAERLGWG